MSKPASTQATATQEPKSFRTDEQVNAAAASMPTFSAEQTAWITSSRTGIGNKALIALVLGKSADEVIARFTKE